MNQKFGLLSNFPALKVKKKLPLYPIPSKGELTDNPPIKNRESLLTDDDSDHENPKAFQTKKAKEPSESNPIRNRILESSCSSKMNPEEDLELTYCSKGEAAKKLGTRSSNRIRSRLSSKDDPVSDTVIGAYSDEELSSRFSVMSVKGKKQNSTRISKNAETVAGAFSDLSDYDEQENSNTKRKSRTTPANKKLQKVLADTIVQPSFSDGSDEDEVPQEIQQSLKNFNLAKKSLPDTVVGGLSDSFTEMSIIEPPPQVDHQIAKSENSQESEYDDDVITILDSEEENEFEDQPPISTGDSFVNCSNIEKSSRKTGSDTTLNQFFNNPPPIDTPERVVSHSVIQRQNDDPAQSSEVNSTLSPERFKIQNRTADGGDIVIPETDESLNESSASMLQLSIQREASRADKENIQPTKDRNIEANVIVQSQKTPVSSTISFKNNSSGSRSTYTPTVINLSAKINISLKISVPEFSESSSSDESIEVLSSSSSEDSLPTPVRRKKEATKTSTPQNSKPVAVDLKKKAKPTGSEQKVDRLRQEVAIRPAPLFVTPPRFEPVIDEFLQEELDKLYGNEWKTPELLKLCKNKNIRDELRKSIQMNNFDKFVKNLPRDLESTRIGMSSGSKQTVERVGFVTPSTKPREAQNAGSSKKTTSKKNNSNYNSDDYLPLSVLKKTPKVPEKNLKSTHLSLSDSSDDESFRTPERPQPKLKGSRKKPTPSSSVKTPRYLDICDPDTPSESSDGDNSNDSDFDANDTWNASSDEEYEDEAARINKRTTIRRSGWDEEFKFMPSTEDRQAKLDRILETFEFKKPAGINTPRSNKKKLFTHSHFDDDITTEDPPKDEPEDKENDEEFLKKPRNFFPTPLPIIDRRVKEIKKATPIKTTPKTKTPSQPFNNFKQHTFLKSLDAEANPMLCDPEALSYRKSYKTKKVELAEKLFKLYNDKVFDEQLSEVPIKWNKKLLNTAGRCNNSRKLGVRRSFLELSDKVLTSADRLRCTLIHEMCHAATWILHGENGHGATWKNWAAKANRAFPELPKINVCHDYIIEYRYTYQCVKCKAKSQAHSKSKKVENIRCSICHGAIEIFLNKRKDGQVVMTPVSKEVKGFAKFVKLKYNEIKKPNMSHKDVMQTLSSQFAALSTQEKQNL